MRLMTAVHPTVNQKRVLALIAVAATPSVAASSISTDANLVAARNMLMKLGAITFANGEAELTDRGREVATSENITDQSGQLTPEGQKLVSNNTQGGQQADQSSMDQGMGDPTLSGDMDLDVGQDQQLPQSEGFSSLLKELLG